MKRLVAMMLVCLSLAGCAGNRKLPLPEMSPSTETAGVTEEPRPEEQTFSTLPDMPEEPVPDPLDSDLVRIQDYLPQARQQLAYASTDNFTGIRIYDFEDAYLRYGTVKKLSAVCDELAEQGLGILVWDGFRPVSGQTALWEACPDPRYVSPPGTGSRTHCRGSAIDLTLVDLETGIPLEMPTGFDDFSAQADRDYGDCTVEAAANAMLLETVMVNQGFKPYTAEWWHYTDTEDYPVEEHFDPAVPLWWEANCEEYISLRQGPGTIEVITTIPKGDAFTLQSWEGLHARVTYQGKEGYVLTSYIKPKSSFLPETELSTVPTTQNYSIERLWEDLRSLSTAYPEETALESIGTSELERQIPVLRIGSEDAPYHVLLQGGIHGREHMTAWTLAALADYWLSHDILSYGNICWHILPMVNPDGTVIAQRGELTAMQETIYKKEGAGLTREEYAKQWKANGLGVDINRNFPAGWETAVGRKEPSSQMYGGEAPFDTAEAAALRDYTLRYPFSATLSYHASGSKIYYEYGNDSLTNQESRKLAKAVETVTGYTLKESEELEGAGYKDWVMAELGIPSITVEVGCQDAPLHERELYSIFVRNRQVLPAVARYLQKTS